MFQSWKSFIAADGLEKTIAAIQQIKREVRRIFRKGNRKTYLIHAIRLEHLQIRKHQKICLKYLQEMEDLLAGQEVKDLLRDNFKRTYKVK